MPFQWRQNGAGVKPHLISKSAGSPLWPGEPYHHLWCDAARVIDNPVPGQPGACHLLENRIMPPTRASESQAAQTEDIVNQIVARLKADDGLWDKLTERLSNKVKENLDTQLKVIHDRIDALETKLVKREEFDTKVVQIESSIHDIESNAIPGINHIIQQLTLSHLDLNLHRRKWGVIVSGLAGDEGEDESKTRKAMIDMGTDKLNVNAANSDFTACHRLKQEKDAPIIARFADLSTRDKWMSNAKKLKGSKVSISVDVPPCLRDVKKELVSIKQDLPAEEKRRSYIRHLPSYPYFRLIKHNSPPIDHTFSKEMIVKKCLDLE